MTLSAKSQNVINTVRENLLDFIFKSLDTKAQEITFDGGCNLHGYDEEMVSVFRDGNGADAKYMLNTMCNSFGLNHYYDLTDSGVITIDDLIWIAQQLETDENKIKGGASKRKSPIQVVLACTNANGSPDIISTSVSVTRDEYDLGKHYDLATEKAIEKGYEKPFVCFDKNELPVSLKDAVQRNMIVVI